MVDAVTLRHRGFAAAAVLVALCGVTLYRANAASALGATESAVTEPGDPDGVADAAGAASPRSSSRATAPWRASMPSAELGLGAAVLPPSSAEDLCATGYTLGGPDHPCVSFRHLSLRGALSLVSTRRLEAKTRYQCDVLIDAKYELREAWLSVDTRHSPIEIESAGIGGRVPALSLERSLGTIPAGQTRQVRLTLTEQDADRGDEERVAVKLSWLDQSHQSARVTLPLPRVRAPLDHPRSPPGFQQR